MINKSNPDSFIWPEFNDDKERIKAYSKKYKDMSIAEAFADKIIKDCGEYWIIAE